MSEGTLTIAHASPDKSRLKERVRQVFCCPILSAHTLHYLEPTKPRLLHLCLASHTFTVAPFPISKTQAVVTELQDAGCLKFKELQDSISFCLQMRLSGHRADCQSVCGCADSWRRAWRRPMRGAAALRSRHARSRRARRSCGAPPAPTCRGGARGLSLLSTAGMAKPNAGK